MLFSFLLFFCFFFRGMQRENLVFQRAPNATVRSGVGRWNSFLFFPPHPLFLFFYSCIFLSSLPGSYSFLLLLLLPVSSPRSGGLFPRRFVSPCFQEERRSRLKGTLRVQLLEVGDGVSGRVGENSPLPLYSPFKRKEKFHTRLDRLNFEAGEVEANPQSCPPPHPPPHPLLSFSSIISFSLLPLSVSPSVCPPPLHRSRWRRTMKRRMRRRKKTRS